MWERHDNHAVAVGSRCGCLLVEEATARSCAGDKLQLTLEPAMDSGIASATVKISQCFTYCTHRDPISAKSSIVCRRDPELEAQD